MKKLLATICAGAVLGLMASCDDAPGKAKAYNQVSTSSRHRSAYAERRKLQAKQNTKIHASTPRGEKNRSRVLLPKNEHGDRLPDSYRRQRDSDGISLVIDGALDVKRRGIHARRSPQRRPYQGQDPQGFFSTVCNVLLVLRRDRVLPP